MTDNEKHLDIREKLQSLPSVKASDDFIMNLQRRINLAEAQPSTQIHKQNQKKLEEGFFSKLFGGRNAWLVPAMGVTAVVFLVFIWVFVVNQNNMTTSDNTQNETITQSENNQSPDGKNETLSSNDEGNNVGETLKTKLPGTEIATNFGYTDSRSELDRGDLEGGFTDEVVSERPEVKISQPTKTEDDVTTEAPAPSMEVRGMKKKEEEKSSMKTGVLKEKKASPPPAEKKEKDSLGNDAEDKIESTDERKRVTRNLIDKTDLENLQEKVEEGIK